MERVSVVECSSYEQSQVNAAVKETLRSLDYRFHENETILIKPNIMSQNRPEQHSITHYSIIDAICGMCRERHCRIIIGDSIAFYQKGLTRKAFNTSKLAYLADKYDAVLAPFEEEPLRRVRAKRPGASDLFIPEIIFEVDRVVNVPKLKTHGGLRLSGALKNMFGCLPGGQKQRLHMSTRNNYELSDIFLDINLMVKPDLTIMDAVVSLDGGPSAIGKPVKTSAILASRNAAAVDVAACRIIGYSPEDISTLLCARQRKIIDSFKEIEVLGDIKPAIFHGIITGEELPKKEDSIFVRHTYVDPAINWNRCTNCGWCILACPADAIAPAGDAPEILMEKCCRCYYCFSFCPEKAIGVQSSLMNKLLRAGRFVLGI